MNKNCLLINLGDVPIYPVSNPIVCIHALSIHLLVLVPPKLPFTLDTLLPNQKIDQNEKSICPPNFNPTSGHGVLHTVIGKHKCGRCNSFWLIRPELLKILTTIHAITLLHNKKRCPQGPRTRSLDTPGAKYS